MKNSEMVAAFHTAFGASNNVQMVEGRASLDLLSLRLGLLAEEYKEVAGACQDVATALYMKKGAEVLAKRRADLLKELCDVLYVTYGFAVTYGLNIDEAFKRVHESNMSKLGEDGKPILRFDGKVLKGPNYFSPNLADLV